MNKISLKNLLKDYELSIQGSKKYPYLRFFVNKDSEIIDIVNNTVIINAECNEDYTKDDVFQWMSMVIDDLRKISNTIEKMGFKNKSHEIEVVALMILDIQKQIKRKTN